MKFTEHLGTHLTPEWRVQYIQYEKLKEVLYAAFEKMPPKDETAEAVVQRFFNKFQDEWFQYCDEELSKINTFFAEKIAEAERKFTALKSELYVTESLIKEGSSLKNLRTGSKLTLATKPDKKKVKIKAKTINDLKLAFSEFYLSLVLIQNYQQLNFTGFRKILKKHDKIFDTTNGVQYRQTKVETANFYTNKTVDDIILEVENLFITELEQGNRSKAMNRLRVPPLGKELSGDLVTFRVGLYFGVFLMLSLVNVIAAFYTKTKGDLEVAIRIYRGIFLIVLVTFLLALNTWGWRKAGVNHVLIFELDPRHHLSYHQLLEVSGLLAVLWSLSLTAHIFGDVVGIPHFIPNLVLVSFIVLFTFNPFKICYYKARLWIIKVLFRIITAPFQHVGFADFWLADQLNSLVVALLDFQYIICFYSHDWHVDSKERICDTNLYGLRPLVACLPAWFRFAQCLRRYKDTRDVFPHLVNAGKYSTSFFVVAFSTLAKSNSPESDKFFLLWIVAAIISTCYTLTWDIKMDWGLLDKKAPVENKFLREETVYRYKACYYLAMLEDFIFRFLWTLTVSVGDLELFHSEILKLVLALCEVFRRFVWNFFRLENEHLNNCGQFRAVRDISFMPKDTHHQAQIEDIMDDENGLGPDSKRKRKASIMIKSITTNKRSSPTNEIIIENDTARDLDTRV
ncbi:xenotropic and polytropic retrovirus receptor 1 homolog [Actinia tenebrosa]|uniref:Xenotropic and polytropic retrovirus receptor 1 homolog n=1 Tax=Actinia tenebrosa TaxID=6105 RepID=A0A6P8IGC9_ACTTE|nr:xenotropic and polytropic retrovirus receptor 1 homolog [Actinia tenebrosa]